MKVKLKIFNFSFYLTSGENQELQVKTTLTHVLKLSGLPASSRRPDVDF